MLLHRSRTRYSKLEYIQLKFKEQTINSRVEDIIVTNILELLPTTIQEVSLKFENIEVRAHIGFIDQCRRLIKHVARQHSQASSDVDKSAKE